jgi:hypothetical protein
MPTTTPDYAPLDEALEMLRRDPASSQLPFVQADAYGPELHNGNSNHAPSAAEETCALGRGDAVIDWVDHYRRSPQPARTAHSIIRDAERATRSGWAHSGSLRAPLHQTLSVDVAAAESADSLTALRWIAYRLRGVERYLELSGVRLSGSDLIYRRRPEAKSSTVAVASTVPLLATMSNSFPSIASQRNRTVEPSAPPYSIWISPAGLVLRKPGLRVL